MTCPICGARTETTVRPFCSKRCQQVDLGRWMTGGYAIPVVEDERGEHGVAEDRVAVDRVAEDGRGEDGRRKDGRRKDGRGKHGVGTGSGAGVRRLAVSDRKRH